MCVALGYFCATVITYHLYCKQEKHLWMAEKMYVEVDCDLATSLESAVLLQTVQRSLCEPNRTSDREN